ncbi:hypothetical protein GCM10019017_23040 [Streptomyces showdoensis]
MRSSRVQPGADMTFIHPNKAHGNPPSRPEPRNGTAPGQPQPLLAGSGPGARCAGPLPPTEQAADPAPRPVLDGHIPPRNTDPDPKSYAADQPRRFLVRCRGLLGLERGAASR